ncbi:MAG: ABC transporter permease subunit [Desulfobacterales bacterium]
MFKDNVIPLDVWVSQFVEWLVDNYRDFFQAIKWPVEQTLNGFDAGLNALPAFVVIAVLAIAAWRFSGKGLAIFTIVSMTIIGLLGLWGDTMTTLAMVLSSAKVEVGHGLDVVMYWDVEGAVSYVQLDENGVTIIFALPPIIRLTSLGIRQVHPELVEAAQAFGATNWQVLIRVQVPLAMPTILAGLNQTIMMALSMVVIAALIGAGGLGSPVILGLNTLDIGRAVIGGLSIVLMAIVLDRVTQSMAQQKKRARK